MESPGKLVGHKGPVGPDRGRGGSGREGAGKQQAIVFVHQALGDTQTHSVIHTPTHKGPRSCPQQHRPAPRRDAPSSVTAPVVEADLCPTPWFT